MASVEVHVDQDEWTGQIQVGLMSSEGFGVRLAGPKYNGSSTNLLSRALTARDVEIICDILDGVNNE